MPRVADSLRRADAAERQVSGVVLFHEVDEAVAELAGVVMGQFVGALDILGLITGGEFTIEAIGETHAGNRTAMLPRITGNAWIYGREEPRIDPSDPFPKGVVLSDSRHSSIKWRFGLRDLDSSWSCLARP